jgi:hypothetical protein
LTWTNTTAFSEYLMTYTYGDQTILQGAYRPSMGGAEITPGGIVIPVIGSGTVEDISATPSTATPNNSLVTLTTYDRRRVSHFKPSEWNRFEDDPGYREKIARAHARDLIGDALTKFYAQIVDYGTAATALGATPTGAAWASAILTKLATIKTKWVDGIVPKVSLFLNESGAAAFALSQQGAFNRAPTGTPLFGEWMGMDIWTTGNALSGSGTVIGGIFSEYGIAYASAGIETLATGEGEPLTGTRLVTNTHTFGIKVLDDTQCYFFTKT